MFCVFVRVSLSDARECPAAGGGDGMLFGIDPNEAILVRREKQRAYKEQLQDQMDIKNNNYTKTQYISLFYFYLFSAIVQC